MISIDCVITNCDRLVLVCVFVELWWMQELYFSWNVPFESSSGHSLRMEGCDVLEELLLNRSWLSITSAVSRDAPEDFLNSFLWDDDCQSPRRSTVTFLGGHPWRSWTFSVEVLSVNHLIDCRFSFVCHTTPAVAKQLNSCLLYTSPSPRD